MVLDQVKSFLPRLLPLERRKYPNFFLSFFLFFKFYFIFKLYSIVLVLPYI